MTETNGRTHEPSLREITAELDGLRSVMDERDRRYEDRFTSAQRAIDKAEQSSTHATIGIMLAVGSFIVSVLVGAAVVLVKMWGGH